MDFRDEGFNCWCMNEKALVMALAAHLMSIPESDGHVGNLMMLGLP
jgi:hypothetical protein